MVAGGGVGTGCGRACRVSIGAVFIVSSDHDLTRRMAQLRERCWTRTSAQVKEGTGHLRHLVRNVDVDSNPPRTTNHPGHSVPGWQHRQKLQHCDADVHHRMALDERHVHRRAAPRSARSSTRSHS
jgi:hypothetical protein